MDYSYIHLRVFICWLGDYQGSVPLTRRFLFTGSREWTDFALPAQVISARMRVGDILVVGAAEDGLDPIVARLWAPFGPVESYPARDFRTPLLRNQHMVDLGADECHAFALKWASGTGNCARSARRAGILTFDHGVSTL